MTRRGAVIAILAIWGVFATAAFRNCGRPSPTDAEPAHPPSLSSADPSEVTQAYWLAARQARAKSTKAVITRQELQQKAAAIQSMEDGKRVWAELAQSYARSAAVNAESVRELRSLPAGRVDPVAVECVAELANFLALQEDLYRKSAEQCGEMAALFAAILAEGDAFDWSSPEGKQYERQEAELTARMKHVVANEGAVEKRRLPELAEKARSARARMNDVTRGPSTI